MSKLAMYLERVSQEDAELETEVEVEQSPEEIAVQEVIVENELEVPEVPEEPVTEEEVEAAELEAEEAVEEDNEIAEEIEEVEGAGEEVTELQESMEHFVQVLQHGLKTKTYSPQFAATVAHQLDKVKKVLGDDIGTPALENYGGENLEEFYQVSLESFNGFLKRVSDLAARIGTAIPDLIISSRMYKGYVARAKAINTKADAMSNALNTVESDATYEGKAPKVLSGFDGNLVTAVSTELKLLAAATGKGLDASAKLVDDALGILDKAIAEGGVGKTGAIVSEAAKLKPVHDAFPTDLFENGLLGGVKLVKASADGEGVRDSIEKLGKAGIPAIDRNKVTATELKLTKAELVKLVSMAKVLAQLGTKAAENSGVEAFERRRKAIGSVTRGRQPTAQGGSNATSWSEGKDLDVLVTSIPRLFSSHVKLYRGLTDHTLKIGEALVELVEKAAKKAKVVSN